MFMSSNVLKGVSGLGMCKGYKQAPNIVEKKGSSKCKGRRTTCSLQERQPKLQRSWRPPSPAFHANACANQGAKNKQSCACMNSRERHTTPGDTNTTRNNGKQAKLEDIKINTRDDKGRSRARKRKHVQQKTQTKHEQLNQDTNTKTGHPEKHLCRLRQTKKKHTIPKTRRNNRNTIVDLDTKT